MILQVIILLAGFAMLVKGADWFVEGAAGIAKKLGIPQLVIGLTIVAMGTSMPEAAVSITAALNGNAGITIGNIVGSNILNILIILGITAVITNVAIQKSTLYYEIPFMTGITLLLLFFGVTDSAITFAEGVIFFIVSCVSFRNVKERSNRGGRGRKGYSGVEGNHFYRDRRPSGCKGKRFHRQRSIGDCQISWNE